MKIRTFIRNIQVSKVGLVSEISNDAGDLKSDEFHLQARLAERLIRFENFRDFPKW